MPSVPTALQIGCSLGGFRLQGKGAAQARRIPDDAKFLEEAGAFSIVLELVPDRLCRLITERAEGCIIMAWALAPTPTASSRSSTTHAGSTRGSSPARRRSSPMPAP